MNLQVKISKSRVEAFSDGVIAILITVMVFDLKVTSLAGGIVVTELNGLLPRLAWYTVSFLMLAIMWVNHHQLFQQIKHADGCLLWLNVHLLFWMSLIPVATNMIGAYTTDWIATTAYSLIFFMCVVAFALLRMHVLRNSVLRSAAYHGHRLVLKKNGLAMALYAISACIGPVSIYVSYCILLIVPAMYFIPERIHHQTTAEK